MSSTSQRITRSLATALAAGAALAPAAAAQHDLRMPDTRDAARDAAAQLERLQDMRMPDTRDAARDAAVQSARPHDLRMPDTRDAAIEAAQAPAAPVVEFVEVPQAGGFDWSDALVGAGGGAGLLLIGAGGALIAVRARRRPGVRAVH
jgi:hypothetical protein